MECCAALDQERSSQDVTWRTLVHFALGWPGVMAPPLTVFTVEALRTRLEVAMDDYLAESVIVDHVGGVRAAMSVPRADIAVLTRSLSGLVGGVVVDRLAAANRACPTRGRFAAAEPPAIPTEPRDARLHPISVARCVTPTVTDGYGRH